MPRLRIEVKVSQRQKDIIERAAAMTSQGVAEFVRSAAEKAADAAIANHLANAPIKSIKAIK